MPRGTTSDRQSDYGATAMGPVAGVGVATGVFLDAYGVGIHAGPTGLGTTESFTTGVSTSSRVVSGPHVRVDVDLPVRLPSPHNLRLTTAFALPSHVDVRIAPNDTPVATYTGSGVDVFLGATFAAMLHDVSLTIGARHISYDHRDATSGISFSGTGVQARLMLRLGDAALHVARGRSMRPVRTGCSYERHGFRCP